MASPRRRVLMVYCGNMRRQEIACKSVINMAKRLDNAHALIKMGGHAMLVRECVKCSTESTKA